METIDPTQAPEAQFRYIERNLDVPLCEGEIFEAANKLAAATQEKFGVEREKSESNQGFNKRIRDLNSLIQRYSSQIANGFEERVVKCKVQFNYPSEGEKTITRLDNNAIVEVLSMDDDEMQEVLPFDDSEDDDTHDDEQPQGAESPATDKTTLDVAGRVRLTNPTTKAEAAA